ncbi:MAG TPA: Crp/Fnr family transcriptional regulator [Pyrinomonadaceae bacterium]|nr:Crp/Fnr family transcriptional regulator [Pyrinomonadaceae bacterium]
MMNRTERSNNLTLKDAGQRYRNADGAAGARPMVQESPGANRAHKFIRPVPFNGLLTNKLLTALPGEDFARLLPYLEPVSLSCGEDLYELEESIDKVYFPESAVISHLYILEDGNTTEAAMVGKEGMTGLSVIFSSPAPTYWTHVLFAGTALRMSAEVLKEEFARGTAMQRLLLSYAGARIAHLSQRAVCNGRHTVGERLSGWLLMIHDRVGDDQLMLTHEQISRHLGTRRASITEAATALRDSGLIIYNRGQLHITDRQGLELAACECYRTLSRQNLVTLQP